MGWMARWNRAVTCLLVAVGVVMSAWATCAEGAYAPAAQQMACCSAGHDRCPMKDSASDCCKQSGAPQSEQGSLGKASVTVTAPPVTTAWAIIPAVARPGTTAGHVSYDSSPPDLLHSPPPY